MLIGQHHVGGGQIALRFPGDNTADDNFSLPRGWEHHWHIDGLATNSKAGGTPFGDINNFTALVGIVLQDATEDNMGNLTVFPGSHVELQRYFEQNGFEDVLTKGVHGLPRLVFSRPPVQIRAQAGDCVVVNYLVAHTIAPNISPYIRYCVYFRMKSAAYTGDKGKASKKNQTHRPESMLDPWVDWHGLHASRGKKLPTKREAGGGAGGAGGERGMVSVVGRAVSGEDEEARHLALALERSKYDK